MKKKICFAIFATLLLLISTLVASDIPYNTLRDVAYHKAVSLFGNDISLGTGIPYYDTEDKLMGYEFGISLQGEFPEVSQILMMVQDKRDILEALKTNGGFLDPVQLMNDLAGIGSFGHIFVSANSTDFPVPEYGQGLPNYYQRFDEAKEYARDYLKDEPSLVRMYYLTPYLKWYCFSLNGKDVFVNEWTLKSISPEDLHSVRLTVCPDAVLLEKKHTQLWKRIKEGDFSVLNGSRAGYIDGVPEYVWSYGCSPTASAMLMGYWDERGYDRLLDYYFNHYDVAAGHTVMNVPNVQKELAIAMNTDTTTGGTYINYIAGGHVVVANNYNGYSFSASTGPTGNSGNDYNWNRIKAEINAGRPFNWSVWHYWFQNEFIGHSTTAFGYTDDKYVIIYNTWGWGEQQWYYYTYHSPYYSETYAITAVPGGSQPDKVTLVIPDNGEIWYAGTTNNIEWTTAGGNIDHLRIDFSRNGGKDWQNLTTNAPNTGSYAWNIQPDTISTYRSRIKLEGYNSGNNLLGTDGSAIDFTIRPQTGCTLNVLTPNGGEVWGVGEVHQITWETYGVEPHHVVLSYSPDGGNLWYNIVTYPNTHSFNWTIPDDTTHSALVKVCGLTKINGFLGEDISDNFFIITETGITEEPSVVIEQPFSVTVSPVPMLSRISFLIRGKSSSPASLNIMDISGRIVKHLEASCSTLIWDGRNTQGEKVTSGIYFYKVNAGNCSKVGKIVKIE